MAKVGRNAPCPCGSGKKYKKCCQLLVERIQRITGLKSTLFPLAAFAEGNGTDATIARAYYSTDTIDLLTWKIEELVLLKNLTEMVRAIELCMTKQFSNSALKLIYVAIDNLAYLGTNRKKVNRSDFVEWANRFLLPDSNLSCSADELWAQRCGLLHQNTGTTPNLSSGMKSIYYTTGSSLPEEGLEHVDELRRDLCKFISISSLESALNRGILKFLEVASKNPALKERLLIRAKKYFVNVEDEAD